MNIIAGLANNAMLFVLVFELRIGTAFSPWRTLRAQREN
jgi:hypothetical protein